MGPYSAVLPGTDEYSGEYPNVPRAHLLSFHAARCALFDRLPPDQAPHVYCFETIGNPDEARAIVDVMSHPPRASRPFWISFQCRDARRIAAGDHIAAVVHAVLARCAARNIVAVGVNCVDVAVVAQLVAAVRAAVQSFMEAREPPQRWRVETVAYPNSGEVWDGRAWVWPHGRRQCTPREWADTVYNTGAGIVGGCCRVGPEGVAELDALRGPI